MYNSDIIDIIIYNIFFDNWFQHLSRFKCDNKESDMNKGE